MNFAVGVVIIASLALALCGYWFFGRTSDTFVVEAGGESDDIDSTSNLEAGPGESRTEDMKDREFAEHMIRANVYIRIYEAFDSATGNKPTLGQVDAVVRAYREGKTTADSFESFIRNRPGLASGDGDDEERSAGKNRFRGDRGPPDNGEDRTAEETSGHDGDDRFDGSDHEEIDNDDRFDTKNHPDATSGHDRFDDDGGENDDNGGENDDNGGENDDNGGENDDNGGDNGEGSTDSAADRALKLNIRRLLKLAGVVVTDDRVKAVMDRARKGLSSLRDLIAEEVSRNTYKMHRRKNFV